MNGFSAVETATTAALHAATERTTPLLNLLHVQPLFLTLGELRQRSYRYLSSHCALEYDSEEQLLARVDRAVLNYIRHRLSNMHELLRESGEYDPLAGQQLKAAVHAKAVRSYPALGVVAEQLDQEAALRAFMFLVNQQLARPSGLAQKVGGAR